MGLLYRILTELIRMVFFVVTQILVLIGNLSKYKLFNEIDIIKDFTNRVYIIIGVLMLFKLVISAVQYLVNPDSLEDKSKGLSALLQRIVISVGLLVFVPAIFQFAIKVEDIVVEQIPNIVFGNRTDVPKNSNGELDFELSADAIAYNVISGFLVPNTGVTPSTIINQSSFKILNITDILNNGCKDGPIALVSGEGCPYQMGYLALLIPIGIYLVVLFGSLAFEIGERTIKFGVIQILSPVPIVNYISDEKKLGEWSKTAIQVYTDLFIKVFVIYFVIEIIILFLNSFAANSQFQGFEAIMVKIAVIIALCLFAKKAPKFVCDLLGIKGADESIGNMFKRAGGLLGVGAAGLRTARSNYTTQKERAAGKDMKKGRQIAEGLRSAAAGFGSATGRGLFMASQGKGFNDVRKNAFSNAVKSRDNRIDRVDNIYKRDVDRYIVDPETGKRTKNPEYYGWREYRQDKSRSNLGIPSTPGYQKAVYDAMESMEKAAGAEKNFGASKMNETPNDIIVNVGGKDYTIATARSFASIQVGTSVTKPDGSVGVWTVDDAAKAASIKEKVEKQTAYLKTAVLLADNDPSAKQNRDETIMAIQNNRTMFNGDKDFPAALYSYIEKSTKDGKRFCTSDKWNDRLSNIKGIDDILGYIKEGPADNSRAETEGYAELIKLYKSVFEDVSERKNIAAHAAEARAKKTQQAIQNDKK